MSYSFPYHYWINSYFPFNVAMSMLWVFPLYFLVLAVKKEETTQYIAIFFISASLILLSERISINERFVSLVQGSDGVVISKANGTSIEISRNTLQRFWPIVGGRGGRSYCYLFIKTKTGNGYRSMSIENASVCQYSAKELNKIYEPQ